ncbi:RNA polymerase sigma factor [Parapedobacter deserti]|uniref:RNA polymerase sigma factor n=1 Tax=Parapedobacter deserti TaxID=1912957 RepID=A0ABV7JGL7_9SPHI
MEDTTANFIAGEQAAFAAVYERYRVQVLAYCYRTTRCRETAEELTHDIFLKLYDARHRLDAEQGIKNYLMAIARTAVLGWFRKIKSDRKLREAFRLRYLDAQSNENTERKIQASIDLDRVKSTVSCLPSKRQEVFQMVRIEDKSYEETAQRLSISIDNVKYHLKKADRFVKAQRLAMDDLCRILVLFALFWG